MSEEAEADSGSVEVEESSFDMESAQDTISNDLFPSTKSEEVDLDQETEEIEQEAIESKDEVIEDVDKVLKEEKEEVKETRKAPDSWKKEMREFYGSADPVLQDYIEKREADMKAGLEQDRTDSNYGRSFRDMLTPYDAMFQKSGVQPQQAVQYLLNAHNALSNGTVEQKQAALQQLSQSYGITKAAEGDNPQLTSLMQRIGQMEQNQNSRAQIDRQSAQTRIQSEVDAFAKDHPLLDDLENEIAGFINQGYDLDEAYKRAERSSENFINSEVERLMKERADKAEIQQKEELKIAKKAKSVNIRGQNTSKAPTGPKGKMFDDMHDIFRDIQSRN